MTKNKNKKPKSLVVLVPAYNEEETIVSTISGLKSIVDDLRVAHVDMHICIVNDGSQDATSVRAKEAGVDCIISHITNRGLGAAVRSGLAYAKSKGYDIAVKFDADLQHNPADILRLIQPLLKDQADIVYGYRFDKIAYKMPLVRRWGNRAFTALMRWMTNWPIKDSQPGIFAVNRAYISISFLPGSYNYTQQVLLDAYHNGLRFQHVDVSFEKRSHGSSFVSLRYPYRVLSQILIIVASNNPMGLFVPLGLFFVALAMLIGGFQFTAWMLGLSDKPIENVNLVLGSFGFGVQTIFFGVLAQLVSQLRRHDGVRPESLIIVEDAQEKEQK